MPTSILSIPLRSTTASGAQRRLARTAWDKVLEFLFAVPALALETSGDSEVRRIRPTWRPQLQAYLAPEASPISVRNFFGFPFNAVFICMPERRQRDREELVSHVQSNTARVPSLISCFCCSRKTAMTRLPSRCLCLHTSLARRQRHVAFKTSCLCVFAHPSRPSSQFNLAQSTEHSMGKQPCAANKFALSSAPCRQHRWPA